MRLMASTLAALLALQQPTTIDLVDQLEAIAKQLRVALTPAPPIIQAPTGVALTELLQQAPVGATVQLAAGGIYQAFVPTKAVTILGATVDARVSPQLAGPKVHGLDRLLVIPKGVSGVTIRGVEFAGEGGGADLIVNDGSHVIFDGLYIHGDAVLGQKRGIALNGADVLITRSYINEIKRQGQDTQAIGSCDGDGPFTIVDNYLEAAGENVIFGGCDPTVANRVATGIRIAGNTITKPLAWKGMKWSIKNLLELKNARDVVVEDNDMSNSWVAGQGGYAILLTVRNQDGHCPWCTVERITIRKNRIHSANGFMNILGRDDANPSGVMDDVLVAENTVDDLNTSAFGTADNPARAILIQGGPTNLRFEDNVVTAAGAKLSNSFLVFGQPQWKLAGFAFRRNTMPQGSYGLLGDGAPAIGAAALDFYAPGAAWEENIVVKGASTRTVKYPAGTTVQ